MATDRALASRPALAAAAALFLACALPACMQPVGLLYSDMTYPLDTNLNATPLGPKTSELNIKALKYPFNSSLQIDWDSNAVGDVMRAGRIQKAYFADKRSLSILLGLFGTETVIVSGD